MCFLSDGTGKDDICGNQLQLRNNQHHLGYHIYARGEIPSRKTHQKITFIHPANIWILTNNTVLDPKDMAGIEERQNSIFTELVF